MLLRPNKRTARVVVALALAGVAGIGLWPAIGQQQLLPPGLGEPAPANPEPTPAPIAPATPGADADVAASDTAALPALDAPPPQPEVYQLPPPASRPIGDVGPLGPDSTGFGNDLFAGMPGRYVTALIRRLDAPVASRWVTILLRRALLSRVPTPDGVRPADWIADRAMLLLRLGDVEGARLLVQAVPTDRFSPKLYQVAAQVALASGDIGGLCPLADAGQALTDEAVWPLARAMCAGLGGEPGIAGALLDTARHINGIARVDLLLAEKITGAGSGGRRSINIEWAGVDRLTTYRFGLATASRTDIPDEMFATAGPQVRAWQASAAATPLDRRASAARVAAALGIASSNSLVGLYAALADRTDPFALDDSIAGRLRSAYVSVDDADRIAALRTLWEKTSGDRDAYAAKILTARAAARLTPGAGRSSDAAPLIAAMLSAGFDKQALRWWPAVRQLSGSDADEAWALLAVGAPGQGVPVTAARARRWAEAASLKDAERGRLFLAGLVALGRIDRSSAATIAEKLGFNLNYTDAFTQRLDAAAAGGRVGEVILLASIGMQKTGWRGVPPGYLLHIIAALKAIGREPEARMIAAEAVTRG